MNKISQNTVSPEVVKANRKQAYRATFKHDVLPIMTIAVLSSYCALALNALTLSGFILVGAALFSLCRSVKRFDKLRLYKKVIFQDAAGGEYCLRTAANNPSKKCYRKDAKLNEKEQTQKQIKVQAYIYGLVFASIASGILAFLFMAILSWFTPAILDLVTPISVFMGVCGGNYIANTVFSNIIDNSWVSSTHNVAGNTDTYLGRSDIANMSGTTNPASPFNIRSDVYKTHHSNTSSFD